MKICIGSSYPEIISNNFLLNSEISKISLLRKNFPDGELYIQILDEDIKFHDEIIIVQSLCFPINDHLVELLLIIDAVKRAGCNNITVIIPYFGYSRQDRKVKQGEPIAAAMVAQILDNTGIKNLITIDLHAPQIEGFFVNTRIHQLPILDIFKNFLDYHFKETTDLVIISPDMGGIKRASIFSRYLGVKLAMIEKYRDLDNNKINANSLIGEVRGKNCLIIDDIISTGSTILECAKLLRKNGALKIDVLATHLVMSKNHLTRAENNGLIDKIITTDSVYHDNLLDNFINVSIMPSISDLVKKI